MSDVDDAIERAENHRTVNGPDPMAETDRHVLAAEVKRLLEKYEPEVCPHCLNDPPAHHTCPRCLRRSAP